jgi:two-component system chemotaxis response regulator CheY
MKILIVDDDFTSRVLLQEMLSPYGQCHMAVNGREAIEAFMVAGTRAVPTISSAWTS